MGRDGRDSQWKRFRERVRETWGVLTEEDLAIASGDVRLLAKIVEDRTGARRKEIEHHLRFLLEDERAAAAEPDEDDDARPRQVSESGRAEAPARCRLGPEGGRAPRHGAGDHPRR